ncbi:MAG: PEGA domain-containing protein [Alphaproteobacteria bacterium]|nr:PEGA domain-containing protein [Alphaproteobacteria bacterium]
MRFLKKLCGVFLSALIFALSVEAAPSWTEAAPKADSNYKYYVGRGEASSEKEAFNQAVKDAYDQAARENFPAEYSYQADIYQTEKSSYLTERTIVSGISARFDGFEKEDESIQKTKSGYTVKLLYKFSKKAIAAEKERLKSVAADRSKKEEMSVFGSKADATKGVLIVETTPVDGAAVYVDGDRYGQTPMTVYGSLSAGQHSLRIDHPRYQTVTENIIAVPGKTVRVKKTLVPAFAEVSVSTDPVNADVFLDGKPLGTAPLTYDRIPVEEEITLSLRHPEMETMSVPLKLKKNDMRPINIVLPEKSAAFSVFSFPSDAEVFIDKRRVGKTPLRDISVSRGSHTFTVEKDGYEPVTRSFAAKGGAKISETVDLNALKQVQTVSAQSNTIAAEASDKFHRYEEKMPPKKQLNLGNASDGEDVLLALMNWSYPSNFIRARVSYKAKDSGTLFVLFFSFDQDNYQNLFIKPAVRALKNVSEKTEKTTRHIKCDYESKTQGQIMCQPPSVNKDVDAVLIKSGPIRHNFWSDQADFEKFILITSADGRRNRIKQYEQRSVTLLVYDRWGKERLIDKSTLSIAKFSTDKNRNVVFMPAFEDGFESFVLIADSPSLKPSDISRVLIKISEGTPIDNPYPPNKR